MPRSVRVVLLSLFPRPVPLLAAFLLLPPVGLSLLDGVPGGLERGPAPVPGGDTVHFPAQFQQQQMQQALYQQEMARQAAIRQQMALQAQQHAQQMAAMSAAQQLAALAPLSQQQSPPMQQRQQLQQHEEWLRKQHEERQQQLQREQQRRSKGSLDILIDAHIQPSRREDKLVELPPASPTPPLSGRTSPAPGQMYPLAVTSPPINARSLSNSSSAPPGTAPTQFHSMFDQAAQGFAQDLVGRRASHDHIHVQTAPMRAATPTSQPVPASPSPSPIPGAPVSASADLNTDSPKSARSDSAANNKPRRDRSPVKREARASLPLDQLKMPFSAANQRHTSARHNSVDSTITSARQCATAASSSSPCHSHLPRPSFHISEWTVGISKPLQPPLKGRQITPFDTPQSTPQAATQSSNGLFDFAVTPTAVAAGEQSGQRAADGAMKFAAIMEHTGEEPPRRPSGEGEEGNSESAWQRRPGYVHEEAQKQQEKKSLSPRKRLSERALSPTAHSPAPSVVVPKRPISDEAKGSISALAAALAASAAQQASVKATQSPAAEARQLAAAAALVPSLPLPDLPAPQPAPVHIPAQPIKLTPPTVPPHPEAKAKTLALQLPRSDSGSITRPADEPSTPVSTNHSSSTTRARSPSSKEYKADMREKVRAEILSTEQFYVEQLGDLNKYYMQPLQRLGPKMPRGAAPCVRHLPEPDRAAAVPLHLPRRPSQESQHRRRVRAVRRLPQDVHAVRRGL